MAVFVAIASALLMLLLWPFRRTIRYFFRKQPSRPRRFRRVVILGLDGLDYGLTRKWLEEGKLPHLAALRDAGSFHALGSTLPPISPVAWSTFQTGVNPGKHNIFDFLTPDERTYRPKLGSVEIRTATRGFGPLKVPFAVRLEGADAAMLTLHRQKHRVRRGEYTDWIPLRFRAGWGTTIRGVCRFMLLSAERAFDLYETPINIDSENPAMAIGYPAVYPIYLAKRQDSYATLGLAEDTWGLSEQVLEDEHFQQQCTDIDREREAMFFDGPDEARDGRCVCVLDGTDPQSGAPAIQRV